MTDPHPCGLTCPPAAPPCGACPALAPPAPLTVEAARANFQREAVRGESDSVVTSACSDVLLHGLPSAGRVVLEGCGHVPGCTHPDAFAEVVRRFLTSSGAAPGAACPGAGGCAHAH